MKPNAITWICQEAYQDLRIVELMIENNICPMLDSSYAVEIWQAQGKPETMRYFGYGIETKQKPYADEPLSVPKSSSILNAGATVIGSTVIGETSLETISQLVDAGCKSITFTAYRWHLIRICGINIPMPFSTQLNTWKKLENLYGEITITNSKRESKFNFCWIILDQTRHFEKLIKWCKDHNKAIGLVVPEKWNENKELDKIYNGLKQFVKTYNEVVK